MCYLTIWIIIIIIFNYLLFHITLFSSLFCFAIRYFDTTIDFINKIDDKRHQTEEYEIATLSTSSITKLDELKGKNIGVYYSNSTRNTEIALKEIKNNYFIYFI